MKNYKKSIIIFALGFGLYSMISNTLKYNNASKWMHALSWIPIVICCIYEFKLFFVKPMNKKD